MSALNPSPNFTSRASYKGSRRLSRDFLFLHNSFEFLDYFEHGYIIDECRKFVNIASIWTFFDISQKTALHVALGTTFSFRSDESSRLFQSRSLRFSALLFVLDEVIENL